MAAATSPPPAASAAKDDKDLISVSTKIECKTSWGEVLAVTGSWAAWKPDAATVLTTDKERYPVWTASLKLAPGAYEYKYIIRKGAQLIWENFKENRQLHVWEGGPTVFEDKVFNNCVRHPPAPGSVVAPAAPPAAPAPQPAAQAAPAAPAQAAAQQAGPGPRLAPSAAQQQQEARVMSRPPSMARVMSKDDLGIRGGGGGSSEKSGEKVAGLRAAQGSSGGVMDSLAGAASSFGSAIASGLGFKRAPSTDSIPVFGSDAGFGSVGMAAESGPEPLSAAGAAAAGAGGFRRVPSVTAMRRSSSFLAGSSQNLDALAAAAAAAAADATVPSASSRGPSPARSRAPSPGLGGPATALPASAVWQASELLGIGDRFSELRSLCSACLRPLAPSGPLGDEAVRAEATAERAAQDARALAQLLGRAPRGGGAPVPVGPSGVPPEVDELVSMADRLCEVQERMLRCAIILLAAIAQGQGSADGALGSPRGERPVAAASPFLPAGAESAAGAVAAREAVRDVLFRLDSAVYVAQAAFQDLYYRYHSAARGSFGQAPAAREAVVHIDLRGYQVDAHVLQAVGEAAESITGKVYTLDLSGCGLTEPLLRTSLLRTLARREIARIRSLRVANNRLRPRGVEQLLEAARALPNLAHLELAGNDVGKLGALALRSFLAGNQTLYELNVSAASLVSDDVDAIMEGAAAAVNLRVLILSENYYCMDLGVEHVANRLRGGTPVMQLQLDNCCVTSSGAQYLADALWKCPLIEVLTLRSNAVRDIGALALAKVAVACKSVKYLDLSHNEISSHGCAELAALVASSPLDLILTGNP